MKKSIILIFTISYFSCLFCQEAMVSKFKTDPIVKKEKESVKISFEVKEAIDVEVAILDKEGNIIKHLAAGYLGGKENPPEPLKQSLSQELVWDGKDDYKNLAFEKGFQVRVRIGIDVKFNRLIGANPYNFGAVESIVADEEGNIYAAGSKAGGNQMAMCVRVFNPEGKYLREILPFPNTVKKDSMKDIAWWDEIDKTFRPRNLRNLNPDFYGQGGGYWANAPLTLVSASTKNGVYLTDGSKLLGLNPDGSIKGDVFSLKTLGSVKNSGGGPLFVSLSPDAKWVYMAGPFSNTNSYGYKFIPENPPGRIYRSPVGGTEGFEEFVTIPVAHTEGNGGDWVKACTNTANFTKPKGPVHQIAISDDGNVYVADRERGQVVVYDKDAKQIGAVTIKNPHLIAVHPKTKAIYVTQYDCLTYGVFQCVVNKFENFAEGAKPVATYEFPSGNWANGTVAMALTFKGDRSLLWFTGVKDGISILEDKNNEFVKLETKFTVDENTPPSWNRIATDYERDEVYISDGGATLYKYSGKDGSGGLLKKDGKPFYGPDLAVGYDGLLYFRTGTGYSGPFERYDHDLNPAPFQGSDSHVLSPYVYSRMGNGYAERGLGVGPDGKCYIAFMYKWVAYGIAGFGPDGKALKGDYLKGSFPADKPEEKGKYPEALDSAIIGPVPQGTANIRVDWDGNIYVGIFHQNKNNIQKKGFETDQGYRVSVGSVIKFGPEGGAMPEAYGEGATSVAEMKGSKKTYFGLAPFSSSQEAFGRNTCCVCRVPRFDLDRFGRLLLPNAITNSVLLMDNAGNLIKEFGTYGNFDAQFVNPNQSDKSIASNHEIPLAWPTGAGFTKNHIFVLDVYNRRAVQLDYKFNDEKTIPIK